MSQTLGSAAELAAELATEARLYRDCARRCAELDWPAEARYTFVAEALAQLEPIALTAAGWRYLPYIPEGNTCDVPTCDEPAYFTDPTGRAVCDPHMIERIAAA